MTDRSKAAQIERMQVSAATAARLRILLSEDVQAYFDGEERRLANKMIEADSGDDDTRRGAALEIRALRALRAHIAAAVNSGDQAARKIEDMINAERRQGRDAHSN